MQIVSNVSTATVPMFYYNSNSTTGNTVYLSTTNSSCNVIYYSDVEKYTYKYSDQCAIFLHPFEILIKKETVKGDRGHRDVRWIHTVNMEGRFHKTFWNKTKHTEEELSNLLAEDSKKWLDNIMISTLKTPSISSS